MNMKKLQMRVGNNQPLNPPGETDATQKAEMEELAQIFQPLSQNQDKNITAVNNDETAATNIPIENIIPSKHNKFKPYEGEKQKMMIDSIKEQGVIVPLTLRKLDLPGNYEIISGENRWRCAKLVGLTHIPAHIVECDEETAIMMLTEANLVNRDITYFERVQAYKQQYEVMRKRSGERSDLKENVEKTDSMDILAKKHGESRTQMYRLVKIADLSERLIELTGNNKIATDAAPKLLALSFDQQMLLADFLSDNPVKVHCNHADLIVKQADVLSYETLDKLLLTNGNIVKTVISNKMKRFARFFESINDANEIEETIEKALQIYFEKQNSEMDEYSQYGEIE